MKQKIMIIGTSHVAPLVKAMPEIEADFPDVEVEFFAVPGMIYRKMSLSPDRTSFGVYDDGLFTDEELDLVFKLNGKKHVSLAGYGSIVIVGHEARENVLARVVIRFSIDGTDHKKLPRTLSAGAFRTVMQDLCDQAALPDEWNELDASNVFVSARPRIAENIVALSDDKLSTWSTIVKTEHKALQVFEIYTDTLAENFAQRGITFIPFPSQVFAPSGLTKEVYSQGAIFIDPDAEVVDFDAKHMNAAFGQISLRNIIETVIAA